MYNQSPMVATRWRSLCTALAMLLILCGLLVGGAASSAAPRELNAARGEADKLARQVAAQEARVQTAAREAAAAAQTEEQYTQLIATGRARAERLRTDVSATEAKLDRARERLRRAQGALAQRLVAMYKGDMPDGLTVMLEADGFSDLATRADYYRAIQDGDERLARRVREVRVQVREHLAAVREAERRAVEHTEALEHARAEISSARIAAQAEAAAFARAHQDQAGRLQALRGEIEQMTEAVQRQQQVSRPQAQRQVSRQVEPVLDGYAIPRSVVMCESGGNYGAVGPGGAGGAYQIMPETWQAYGGQGSPQDASRAEQDRVAAQIWADSGPSAWTCAR